MGILMEALQAETTFSLTGSSSLRHLHPKNMGRFLTATDTNLQTARLGIFLSLPIIKDNLLPLYTHNHCLVTQD